MFILTYILLFMSCLSGLFVLMMASQKRHAQFASRHSQSTLKHLGVSIIAGSGILSILIGNLLGHTVYTVMAWCLILSLTAGLIYIGLIIYDIIKLKT